MKMDSDIFQNSILNAGRQNQHILKEKVWSKAGSMHALLALAKEANVDSFHSSLLELKAVDKEAATFVKSGIQDQEVNGKKLARKKCLSLAVSQPH